MKVVFKVGHDDFGQVGLRVERGKESMEVAIEPGNAEQLARWLFHSAKQARKAAAKRRGGR